MNNFWKGTLSPVLHKTVGRVTYIPLVRMSPSDWEWLDYDNIRSVARNRIAETIVSGDLLGFFQINVIEKAAKAEYLWPATAKDIQEFSDSGYVPLRHEAEVDSISDATRTVESLRFGAAYLSPVVMLHIIEALGRFLADEEKSQSDEVDLALLESLTAEAAEILLIAIMMWALALEEAEALLDDLPESDEVDEIRDWINDRVDEIEAVRQAA